MKNPTMCEHLDNLRRKPRQRAILLKCHRGETLTTRDARAVSAALNYLVLLNTYKTTLYTITDMGHAVAIALKL